MNFVQVIDNGKGNILMSANSGHTQTFMGVATTIIQAQRARTDQFSFKLNDTVTAVAAGAGSTFHQPGPSTGSTAIELGSSGPRDAVTPGEIGRPLDIVRLPKMSGHAIQGGSLLTVTVDRPKTNVVQITNEGAGNVQVEWNGASVHSFAGDYPQGPTRSFAGVANIVVDTRNARKDQVTLVDAAP
jgi:hypothetical protein